MDDDLKRWLIYLDNAEFARANGDPCFGTVVASSKEEAEAKARSADLIGRAGWWGGCGPWAVLIREHRS